MSKTFLAAFAALGLAALQSTLVPQVATAAIVCKDGFQKSGGGWISTPYCNDAYLAHVAREHGVKVSDNEVRASDSKKYELCRFIGSDARVQTYCPDSGSSDTGH